LYTREWYKLDKNDFITEFHVDFENGLNDVDVRKRLEEYGYNRLREKNGKSPWKIFLMQFTSAIVVVLLVAAVITGVIGEFRDTIVISVILVINALLGFSQEYRAEKAMNALKKLSVPKIRVRRSGKEWLISSEELVPGDYVFLEAGNYIPADIRLLESHNFKVQESALTGESQPVEKEDDFTTDKSIPLADRKNMIFSGTVVTYGRGTGIVVRTGMDTEIGKIASMIQETDEEQTPMQKRLDKLGKILALAALAIVAVIFVMGLLRGEDLKEMFMVAVSFAVAAVPEGLPTVVTIALALGARRMLKQNALVRKLMAVETLGSVDVICSDKTGTITENRMRVTVLEIAGNKLDFGVKDQDDPESLPEDDKSALSLMFTGGSLCNDAIVKPPQSKKQQVDVIGDPTEGALVFAAMQVGIEKETAEKCFERKTEIPFESERKMMSTVHHIDFIELESENPRLFHLIKKLNISRNIAFTKGALDQLMKHCDNVLDGDEILSLNDELKSKIMKSHDELAQNGMRVLGIACRTVDDTVSDDYTYTEDHMTFIGMFGMMDPEREGVKEAVATAKRAGIRPIMITGDHPLTAGFIAQKLEIIKEKSEVIKGAELDGKSDDEIDRIVREKSVYARVSPENKLQIVRSLQRQQKTVAMTGDGVNDAPALKKADIGLAMGITGTDVSKEVSDIVLMDDNFSTIVSAIKEGRTIYDNVQKFIKYILASNIAEIWIMLLGPFMGMSLPMLPLQILWINLISDGLPALALSVEPSEAGIMKRKPNPVNGNVIGTRWIWLLLTGLLIAAFSMIPGLMYKTSAVIDETWRTMLFTTLVFGQLFFTFCVRSGKSLFKQKMTENPYMIGAVVIGFVLQFAVLYIPFMNELFGTVPLNFRDLMISFGFSTLILWVYEIVKLIKRIRYH